MFASLRNKLKWSTNKPVESKNQCSLILSAFIGILEDVLFWKNTWLSLSFIFLLNVLLLVSIYENINPIQLILYFSIFSLSIDGFETWLKHKHRTTFLKRLAEHDGDKLNTLTAHIKVWINRKWIEFIHLREANHTKAFLLVNISLSMLFIIGKYLNGYILLYTLCMLVCFFKKWAPPTVRLVKKIQISAESDMEYEGLIPEVSDLDINILSIEPEHIPIVDDRQSLDYWKPVDVPIEEGSDSSDSHSSSLVTNLSLQKMKIFDKNVETSDSSEDEYIPLDQQREQSLQSTLEVTQPTDTWSSSAYNALWNLTGAVSNMMYTKTEDKRKRVSSIDSSDGFEMIDKNDL